MAKSGGFSRVRSQLERSGRPRRPDGLGEQIHGRTAGDAPVHTARQDVVKTPLEHAFQGLAGQRGHPGQKGGGRHPGLHSSNTLDETQSISRANRNENSLIFKCCLLAGCQKVALYAQEEQKQKRGRLRGLVVPVERDSVR